MTRRPVIDLLLSMDGYEEREALYHVKRRKIHAARARQIQRLGTDTNRVCAAGEATASGADEKAPAAGEDQDDTTTDVA